MHCEGIGTLLQLIRPLGWTVVVASCGVCLLTSAAWPTMEDLLSDSLQNDLACCT